MIHRYFAMAIGVLIIAQMLIAWTARIKRRPLHVSPWWPTSILLLIVVQGAFGAWTVTMKLQPVIVTTHLLLGLALLGTLGWLAARQTPIAGLSSPKPRAGCRRRLSDWCCWWFRSRWAAGSAPTTRCSPARTSRLCNGAMDSADELRARLSPVARARHDR